MRTRRSRVSLLFDTRGRRSENDVQYIKLFSQTSLVALRASFSHYALKLFGHTQKIRYGQKGIWPYQY